jgi:hypothetical protein
MLSAYPQKTPASPVNRHGGSQYQQSKSNAVKISCGPCHTDLP